MMKPSLRMDEDIVIETSRTILGRRPNGHSF